MKNAGIDMPSQTKTRRWISLPILFLRRKGTSGGKFEISWPGSDMNSGGS